jgi:hypothetical protein
MEMLHNDLYYIFINYLCYNETLKLTNVNKLFNNLLQNHIINYKQKAKYIINFFKYIKNQKLNEDELLDLYVDDVITHKQLCMLYFWYYPKELVSSWTNTCEWKRNLLIQYVKEDEVNINNRYDLYKIMCKLPKEVILRIGY